VRAGARPLADLYGSWFLLVPDPSRRRLTGRSTGPGAQHRCRCDRYNQACRSVGFRCSQGSCYTLSFARWCPHLSGPTNRSDCLFAVSLLARAMDCATKDMFNATLYCLIFMGQTRDD